MKFLKQIQSTVATGTSPLSVASTTLVSNLNVDLLDNQHGSYYLDYTNFTNKPDLTAYLLKSGGTMTGALTLSADPTANMQAATKQYVDSKLSNLIAVGKSYVTATSGQTSFTVAGGYTPGFLEVYMNGLHLQETTDFTASNGASVVLNIAANAGDELTFISFNNTDFEFKRQFNQISSSTSEISITDGYRVGLIDVYVNGVRLHENTDFTAINETTVSFLSALESGDQVEFVIFENVSLTTTVKTFNGRYGNITLQQSDFNGLGIATESFVSTSYLQLSGGTVTGPITLAGNPTSSNHAANKGYVDTQIANIVNSAPSTLDTLNELSLALNNDANFSATVATNIGTKVSKTGDTISGKIIINTEISSDVAIQAINAHANGYGAKIVNASTSNYALGISGSDYSNKIELFSNGNSYFFGNMGVGTSTPSQKLDVNGNIKGTNFIKALTSTSTAAGTTTLTSSSSHTQVFTGTTTQTIILPVTSTLSIGWEYRIINNSSADLTIKSSGGDNIFTMTAGTVAEFIVLNTSSTAASAWLGMFLNRTVVPVGANNYA